MRHRRLALGAICISGIALALWPAAASAGFHRVRTDLQFTTFGLLYSDGSYDWAYYATVDASRNACVRHRRVRFFRRVSGGPDDLLGAKRSDSLGEALLVEHQPDTTTIPGDYYATARRAKVRTRRATLKCRHARSSVVSVTAPTLLAAHGTGPASVGRSLLGR